MQGKNSPATSVFASEPSPLVTPIKGEVSDRNNFDVAVNDTKLPVLFGCNIDNNSLVLYITDQLIFKKMKPILHSLNIRLSGVATPYLYVFDFETVLAWHLEPEFGNDLIPTHKTSKIWFWVLEKQVLVINAVMRQFLGSKFTITSTVSMLGHNRITREMLSVKNITRRPLYMAAQDHMKYGGLNGTNNVLPCDIFEYVCEVRRARPTDTILALTAGETVGGNLSSTVSHHCTDNTHSDSINGIVETVDETIDLLESPLKEESVETDNSHTDDQTHSNICSKEIPLQCACVGAMLLQCPACCQLYKGGPNRLERLFMHIIESHQGNERILLEEVRGTYRFGHCPLEETPKVEFSLVPRAPHCSLHPTDLTQ